MPVRKINFFNSEIYHLMNRGVARAPIFSFKKTYQRFIEGMDFYRYRDQKIKLSHFLSLSYGDKENLLESLKLTTLPQIEILGYCLMPNHFHFLIRQVKDNGISFFMKSLLNSYSHYFNILNNRAGPLFQGRYKAIHIATDEQLMHVLRYIHLNPVTSKIISITELSKFPWSSYPNYLGERTFPFIDTEFFESIFSTKENLKNFHFDEEGLNNSQTDYGYLFLE